VDSDGRYSSLPMITIRGWEAMDAGTENRATGAEDLSPPRSIFCVLVQMNNICLAPATLLAVSGNGVVFYNDRALKTKGP